MTKFDKTLISYISTTTDFADIDISVEEHHGRKYLIARVDVEKIDENSPRYDQSYAEKLVRKRKPNQPVFITPMNALEKRLVDARKFFGELEYKTAFLPKNHEFLDNIEKKVQDAVKEISPEFDAGISWDSDYPKPVLTIYLGGHKNYNQFYRAKYGLGGENFLEDIEKKVGNNISLRHYQWRISSSKKTAD
jgi:hypothetical protein